jgi:hypothetical protein
MRPEQISVRGLALGLAIDTSEEPNGSILEYQNHQSQLSSYRSEKLQVTTRAGIIVGLSALSFSAFGEDISFYCSEAKVEKILGKPLLIKDLEYGQHDRVFLPPTQSINFRQQGLTLWKYGDNLELFFTKFDPFEGFKFRGNQFWSIAIGELWLPSR